MPDTNRLYALSSTFANPWWTDAAGPGLVIHDAVLAMRWYLSNEREGRLTVTGHVSEDGGATWRPLHTGELLADAEQALQHAEQAGGTASRTAALLREAMAAEAASWLDARIRYVPPDDPAPYRPARPDLPAWERGGQIWALALSSVPPDAVLARLAARYTSPQPDGPEHLRTGARRTLSALALVNDPAGADVRDLLAALDHLNELTFGSEMGQLRTLAEDAQRNLADHLVSRLPPAAAPTGLTTEHPVQQAADADIDRLAGLEGVEGLRVGARDALAEALAKATGQAAAAPASQDTVGSGDRAAIPGYPRHLPSEQQAAAQWRAISPVARRAAEQAMSQLEEAATALTEATASGAVHRDDPVWVAHTEAHRQLEQLTARHALLMHAAVLADAEAAAVPAAHQAVVAAAQATAVRDGSTTAGEAMTDQAGFTVQVKTVQDRIAKTLTEQQQVTSDALHRLFMYPISSSELHLMRTQLIDDSGLGLDAYNQAYRTLSEAGVYLQQLEAGYHPEATPEQVVEARTRVQQPRGSSLICSSAGTSPCGRSPRWTVWQALPRRPSQPPRAPPRSSPSPANGRCRALPRAHRGPAAARPTRLSMHRTCSPRRVRPVTCADLRPRRSLTVAWPFQRRGATTDPGTRGGTCRGSSSVPISREAGSNSKRWHGACGRGPEGEDAQRKIKAL